MGRQILGVDVTKTYSSAEFGLGTCHTDVNGNEYLFVKNSVGSATTAKLTYRYDASFELTDAIDTTVAGTAETNLCGVAQAAISDGEYGWIFAGPGSVTASGAGAIAANAKIYTSATAGKLDDDSAAGKLLPGVVATTAIGSAGDVTLLCAGRMYVES